MVPSRGALLRRDGISMKTLIFTFVGTARELVEALKNL